MAAKGIINGYYEGGTGGRFAKDKTLFHVISS